MKVIKVRLLGYKTRVFRNCCNYSVDSKDCLRIYGYRVSETIAIFKNWDFVEEVDNIQ